MPVNRGQGRKSRRWYQLCMANTSTDSSDDSDTESVVLPPSTPTQTITWQEPSPPLPPNREPQINWLDPPPPPSPPFFSPPPSPPSREPQINSPPFFTPPPSPPSREPQINLLYPPPPFFPPSPPLQAWAATFDNESQHGIYEAPSPTHAASLDNDPSVSPSVVEQGWPEFDKSKCLQVPAIRRVKISELHQRDKLSHCPICMEEFKMGDKAIQLPCNHTYRSECILRWLDNNKTCPVCRLQLDGWEVKVGILIIA